MKKMVVLMLSMLFALTAVPGCSPAVIPANSQGLTPQETPQTYVLRETDDVNAFTSMPTVTLYQDGSARLSQPVISSLALLGKGRYQVSGDELSVRYEDNTTATFAISDGGDTLTLKSASLGFTKVGAVYHYRSTAEYLKKYNKIEGEALTLEAVRELAPKGGALTPSDFKQYACVVIDPDYRVYDVEGGYTLTVICAADGNTSCTIERKASGESFALNLNGSTGLEFDDFLGIKKIIRYEPKKWLDYFHDDQMPWKERLDLTLPEFPGVTLTWTPEKVAAGEKDLIWGMPVWNVYLADLTNDGKPELCATVSFGSGIVDTHVVVYDLVKDKTYQLADRIKYDYYLSLKDGKLMVTQLDYHDGTPLVAAELRLVDGEIFRFGNR